MTASSLQISMHDDLGALSKALAEEFFKLAQSSLAARQQFAVALTGGRSAGKIYEQIAESGASRASAPLDWNQVKIFWGDERTVPLNSPDSNYKTAQSAWLAKSSIPVGNTF